MPFFLLQKAARSSISPNGYRLKTTGAFFVFGGGTSPSRAHTSTRVAPGRALALRLARARPRAAMSAAVAPPGAGLDANALVDLDLLQGELDAARGQVEMWCAQRELAMKEAVAAHKTNMMESEEQYVKLVEREKDLAASGEELARRKEFEAAELDALKEEAAQAKELGEGLPEQLQMLREQVASERAELDAADGALKSEESVKARQLEAHLGAVALYRERLGLRFEVGDDEDLRFFFVDTAFIIFLRALLRPFLSEFGTPDDIIYQLFQPLLIAIRHGKHLPEVGMSTLGQGPCHGVVPGLRIAEIIGGVTTIGGDVCIILDLRQTVDSVLRVGLAQ